MHNMDLLRTYNVKFYLNNNQNQLNDFEILNTLKHLVFDKEYNIHEITLFLINNSFPMQLLNF